MSLPLASLCSIEPHHPFVPTRRPAEHRAQRQSRMPPAQRRHRQSRRAASLTERARCYPPGAGRSLRDTALPQPGAGISRLLLAIVTSRFPRLVTVASSRPCRPKDRSGIDPVWTFSARPSAGLSSRIFRLIIGGGSSPIKLIIATSVSGHSRLYLSRPWPSSFSRRPGERRDLFLPWIPAFAGMTGEIGAFFRATGTPEAARRLCNADLWVKMSPSRGRACKRDGFRPRNPFVKR